MKGLRNLIIGIIVAVALLFMMFSYRVRYNEMVIVTTFDRADEASVKNADGKGDGLHFMLPWPIQKVAQRYDTRVQVLDDRLEERQTRDKQGVVLSMYMLWRVKDPLQFYRSVTTMEQGQKLLNERLRNAGAQVGNFDFGQLVNPDPEKVQLPQLEEAMRKQIQSDVQAYNYGVEVVEVGVKRLIFAESVTQKVFSQMRSNRQALAQATRSQGESEATTIRATAAQNADRILSFANRRAVEIRSKGDEAASKYYPVFQQAPELAILLRRVEEAKKVLSHQATFIFRPGDGPLDLFPSRENAPAKVTGAPEAGTTSEVRPTSPVIIGEK